MPLATACTHKETFLSITVYFSLKVLLQEEGNKIEEEEVLGHLPLDITPDVWGQVPTPMIS